MRIKILIWMIFIFVIFSILVTVHLYSELNVHTIKFGFIVNNFLEHYYKPDESLPEIILGTNSQCLIPFLKYDNQVALEHLDVHSKKFASIFQMCQVNKSLDIESFVKISSKTSNGNEIYSIKFNMNLLKRSLELKSSPICTVQRFNKEMNISEESNKLVYFTKESFDIKLNFTVTVNETGYYYVKCVSKQTILDSLVFDYVYTILPLDMSKLMNKRQYFRALEDKFTKPYKDLPLLRKNDFKECFKQPNSSPKMNVLIIGLDSVSSSHFKRIFPRTFAYLNDQAERNFIFENLNSVGTNTYPNILALLAGMVEETVKEFNIPGEISFFRNFDQKYHDLLPFIWKEFEKLGYVTMYQEDDPNISIFNYYKDGFRYSPTGLYNRAFNLQYYKIRSGPDKCHFKKPSYLTWMNQIELFITQMNKDVNKKTPYFSFNFLTEYTHDYFSIPSGFDEQLEKMLSGLDRKGFLDNTMVILMGDHGQRILSYSYATEMGKLERYRPFLSIKLPEAFTNTAFLKNIEKNQNKLVSFFDIYQTLRHFLFLNKYDMKKEGSNCSKQFEINSPEIRISRGISLFQNIPAIRNCFDALIPNKLCNCYKQKEITAVTFRNETGFSFEHAAAKILNEIIQLTNKHRHFCEIYHLSKNHSMSFKKIDLKQGKFIFYKVVVVTDPGEAWFESNILYDDNLKEIRVHSTPTRMSMYGKQSECVNDSVLKNFCFCKS